MLHFLMPGNATPGERTFIRECWKPSLLRINAFGKYQQAIPVSTDVCS
jgi:hypothetical protein